MCLPCSSRHASRLYDGEVAWSDDLLGRVDAILGRLGLRKDSLLVVTYVPQLSTFLPKLILG